MSTKIERIVEKFYNETPFPDYELNRFNTKEDLRAAARTFVKILNRSIPKDASVIDIGTGTGQLAAFLSLRRRCVWGIDFSDISLNKAKFLKQKLGLNYLHLKKVDIMDIKQIENIKMKFDYALCFGVLHHTSDAYQGFKNILELLKPKGYIAIGLYNKMGRVPLKIRRFLVKTIFKDNELIKNWFIKMQIGDMKDKKRLEGWWNDQYTHPHETTHTIGEVLQWFKKNNIEYYQTVPSSVPFDQTDIECAGVWNKTKYPCAPIRFYKQLTWLWRRQREGGYWITFGRKR